MAVREILLHPHPALKRVAEPLHPERDADRIAQVRTDLLDTMADRPGCVGIAAPQIGEEVRIAIVDVTGHPKAPEAHGLLVLVNPVVPRTGAESEIGREGCLSLPHLTANVRRPTELDVEGDGLAAVTLTGFEARCVAHELDHLDGILFLDRVASLTEDVFRRKRYR